MWLLHWYPESKEWLLSKGEFHTGTLSEHPDRTDSLHPPILVSIRDGPHLPSTRSRAWSFQCTFMAHPEQKAFFCLPEMWNGDTDNTMSPCLARVLYVWQSGIEREWVSDCWRFSLELKHSKVISCKIIQRLSNAPFRDFGLEQTVASKPQSIDLGLFLIVSGQTSFSRFGHLWWREINRASRPSCWCNSSQRYLKMFWCLGLDLGSCAFW